VTATEVVTARPVVQAEAGLIRVSAVITVDGD
jgi:hypothetical protein